MGKGGEMAGMILFSSYCSSCHQRNGMGDNNRYPPLVNSEFVTGDKDRLIKIILNGLQGEITVDNRKFNGQMPAHGSFLDDHAVASIVTFIKRRFAEDEKFTLTSEEVGKIRSMGK